VEEIAKNLYQLVLITSVQTSQFHYWNRLLKN